MYEGEDNIQSVTAIEVSCLYSLGVVSIWTVPGLRYTRYGSIVIERT